MRPRVGGLLSSVRLLFADFIGDEGGVVPPLPEGLPDSVIPAVEAGAARLIDYQGPRYARLYLERLRRFVGRREIDPAQFARIAQLMALRMSYEDPIRIAQFRLRGEDAAGQPVADDHVERCRFRFDELVGALPAKVAAPVLMVLERIGWVRRRVTMRFCAANRGARARLRIEAELRRWRLYSIRYGQERIWVERWLHMINRSLVRHPEATTTIIETATMVRGYGEAYRYGLADWHAIIDGLAKPAFDGALHLSDLASAIEQARAAATPDPRQVALKAEIARLRAPAAIAA